MSQSSYCLPWLGWRHIAFKYAPGGCHKPKLFPAFLIGICLSSPSYPQAPVVMEDVVVEGRAVDEVEAREPSAFVTVIEADDYARRTRTVPELLESSVGVNVRRFGGLGSFSSVSVRGSSAQQVTVLLDGVPLDRAKFGVVDLGTVPMRSVERIEVFRGFAPLRFRTSAIGGVVNVITKQPRGKPGGQASAAYGSFGTYQFSASGSGGFSAGGVALAGNYSRSDGDFDFNDDNGTRVNPSDDEKTRRRNNDFEAGQLLAKLAYDLTPNLNLQVSNNWFRKEQGVPGISSNQSLSARLHTRRNIFNLRLAADQLLVPELEAEWNLYSVVERTRFKDKDGDIGLGRQDNTNKNLGLGLDGYGQYYWGEHQVIGLLGSARYERFKAKDDLAVVSLQDDPQKRTVWQGGIEDTVYLWDERLVLSPQVSYSYLDNNFDGTVASAPGVRAGSANDSFWDYQLGARLELGRGVALRANAGRAHRAPTLNELFGDQGTVVGNPRLKPEKGDNWDLGVVLERRGLELGPLSLDRTRLELVGFYSKTDDLILFEQNSQRTIRPINISSSKVRGVELSAALGLFRHWELSGNYTYQDTENTSDIPFQRGNQLPGRPKHQAYVRVETHYRWLRPYYEFNYLAGNYLDQANLEKLESRKLHNAGLTITPHPQLSLTFEVDNITNKQVSDVLGFPLPGRSYMGTLLIEF